MKRFEYEHIVSFEETNLVGNVYFANHIKWQGICRERFLLTHMPEIVQELEEGRLVLITLHCSCDYHDELRAFDQVKICMYLDKIIQNRVRMNFEYYKIIGDKETLVAKGKHEIGCFRKEKGKLLTIPIPLNMKESLELYKIYW